LFFLLVAGVVGVFWCFLLILGQMVIFGVGYFRRSVAWVLSPDLDDVVVDKLDEDPAQISPDTPALSPDPMRYTYVYVYRIQYLEGKKKE